MAREIDDDLIQAAEERLRVMGELKTPVGHVLNGFLIGATVIGSIIVASKAFDATLAKVRPAPQR